MTDTKQVYSPKAIDLKNIYLINYQGVSLPLDNMLISFHMYEDIFSNTMSFQMELLDGLALIERMPLLGEEVIAVEFGTPTFDSDILAFFDLYKIDKRDKVEERADQYFVYGVSREFITSLNRKADRAYTGKAISTIVSELYQNTIKSKRKNKPLVVEQSRGLHSFIAPTTSPFDFINLIASEAQSDSNPFNSNYVFYEDHDQFNFRTISSMYKEEPVEDFYWAEFDQEERKLQDLDLKIDDSQKIMEIEYLNTLDIIKQLNGGQYDNNSLVIDLIFKKTEDRIFLYNEDYQKLTTLGNSKLISPTASNNNNDGFSHRRYFLSNLSLGNYHQTSYLNRRCPPIDPTNFYPFIRHKFISTTIAANAGLNNIGMNIMVPGNSRLKCGQIINVYIPGNASDEEDKIKYNKFFGNHSNSARFLIIRADHYYNKGAKQYVTQLKIIKDTYAEDPIVFPELDENGEFISG